MALQHSVFRFVTIPQTGIHLCHAGLKAARRQKASLPKKLVAKNQKRKNKAAVAEHMDDAAEAVLQGQQQVLGDLSQARY